jgi:hypothetical protein
MNTKLEMNIAKVLAKHHNTAMNDGKRSLMLASQLEDYAGMISEGIL